MIGPMRNAPFLARPWDHHRITLVTAGALAPALGVALFEQPGALVPALATAMLVSLAWCLVFAHVRGTTLGWDWIVTAATFAILVPGTVPMWQQVMALSFGVVMGEQVFGGRGRNFLHPTVVALAFLMFSFPGEIRGPETPALAVAAGAGAVLLLGTRLVSWRVLAGVAMATAAGLAVAGEGGGWTQLPTAVMVFCAVFLIADPVAAACTNPGRWAYGLLAGMLLVVFGNAGGDPGSLRAVIFAALLASTFAPLIDQVVIWLNIRRRHRRG